MTKFIPQNWNDSLALLLILGIIALWVIQPILSISFSDTINGALIVTWTLIVQFYFRRKPTNGGG